MVVVEDVQKLFHARKWLVESQALRYTTGVGRWLCSSLYLTGTLCSFKRIIDTNATIRCEETIADIGVSVPKRRIVRPSTFPVYTQGDKS